MVNATNKFFKRTKEIMKEKGLSPFEYVICFICDDIKKNKDDPEAKLEVSLNFVIVPLEAFEKEDYSILPFDGSFYFYKKSGCFCACNTSSFFHLINKRLSINKEGELIFLKAPMRGMNSICGFFGKSLLEYMKSEKFTRKELSRRLKIPYYKINLICKGKTGKITLSDMIAISFEFQGKNNISTYSVLIEKYPEKIRKEVEN